MFGTAPAGHRMGSSLARRQTVGYSLKEPMHRLSSLPRRIRTILETRVISGLVLFPTALVACSAESESGHRPHCAFASSALTFSEASSLGFSAAEATAPITGEYSCDWTWNDPAGAGTMYPPSGSVSGRATLAYTGGEVLDITGSVVGDNSDFRLACPSWMSAVVNVELSADDGGLDDNFAIPVEFRTLDADATSVLDISAEELAGTYTFSWAEEWPTSTRVLKNLFRSDGVLLGQLYEQAHHDPRQAAGVTTVDGVVFRSADWTCDRTAE